MESVVHRLGLALGGRPGHSLAERLAIPVSKDTLLRTVRRRAVPTLIVARDLVDRFQAMIRNRAPEELDPWITAARESALSSFAVGIASDRNAVRAALMQPWSNGQTEGQITKLKLVKRQMYGRAKLDLLEARLIGAA